ncbi:MAG: VWA domain-containing protein [Cytophagaceae bacterium]|nr:VWA domain-containing protein [Cytophagaceae bacterium]MDW8455374.1 VWA domain-containing protein [Cytophagaceae bacterium]
MKWIHSPDTFLYLFISSYVILYAIYVFRIVSLLKHTKLNLPDLLFKFVLRSSYVSLMSVSLLGPSFGDVKKELQSVGKSVCFLIDLSLSMDATDIAPSRIAVVRRELEKIIKELHSDRMSMIVFNDVAYLHCPSTYEQSTLLLHTAHLSTSILPEGSTDILPALQLANQKCMENKWNNLKEPKVIILITDGELFLSTEYNNILNNLKKNQINLFVVGVGSQAGGKIPISKDKYKTDAKGQPVITKSDFEFLKHLAEDANGKYYEWSDRKTDTENIIMDLKKIKGAVWADKKIESNANKYFYFLSLSCVLMLIDLLISVKTKHS